MKKSFGIALILFVCGAWLSAGASETASSTTTPPEARTFVVAVTDPMAKDLACDCIAGFAQRDYRVLSGELKKVIGDMPQSPQFTDVKLVFANSVAAAIEKSSSKRVDLVIGKDSVVRAELKAAKMPAALISRLTDQKGSTDFTGLIVVASDDPATSVADLKNHRIVLGPPECDEKYAAAIRLFEANGVTLPPKPETAASCTIAGLEIVSNESETPVAVAVSDYALVLIEGCKTIEKGALRVLARTEPVPFISVFRSIPEGDAATMTNAADAEFLSDFLKSISADPAHRKTLETQNGFVSPKREPGQPRWEIVGGDAGAGVEADSKN